jgi:hypothetical protein
MPIKSPQPFSPWSAVPGEFHLDRPERLPLFNPNLLPLFEEEPTSGDIGADINIASARLDTPLIQQSTSFRKQKIIERIMVSHDNLGHRSAIIVCRRSRAHLCPHYRCRSITCDCSDLDNLLVNLEIQRRD